MTDTDDSTPAAESSTSSRRWIKWAVIGVVAAVVLFFGGIFVYANFINDSPDALDESDLSNALTATTTAPAPDATTGSTAADTTPADTTPTTDTGSAENFDGDWVPTTASEFGYRVEEVLAGVNTTAVGRSNEIEGLLTIEGTTATVVDITVPAWVRTQECVLGSAFNPDGSILITRNAYFQPPVETAEIEEAAE